MNQVLKSNYALQNAGNWAGFTFFNLDSLYARLNSHYETRFYKVKKHKKITAYSKICNHLFNLQLKDAC